MDKATERSVRLRAENVCEYCRLPERYSMLKFTIDHILARQHGGTDKPENLALACGYCNHHKGPNIAGIDPESGYMTRLFEPRLDTWSEHFFMKRTTRDWTVRSRSDNCCGAFIEQSRTGFDPTGAPG